MGLETGTHVSDLVVTNPVGATDERRFGDDHLRLIKSVLKTTFPDASVPLRFPRVHSSLVTSGMTLVAGDDKKIFLLDALGGSFTISLPASAGLTAGWSVGLKHMGDQGGNGDNNRIILDPNGTDIIEGMTVYSMYPTEWFDLTYIGGGEFAFFGVGRQSRVLIGELSGPSSALAFVLRPESRFKSFEFDINGLLPVTNNVTLFARVSTNSGTSYEVVGYVHCRIGATHDGGLGASGSGSTSQIIMVNNVGNDSPNVYHAFGKAWLFAGISVPTVLHWELTVVNTSGFISHVTGMGRWGVGANAIGFFYDSGNIATGTIRMYGCT